MLNFMHTTTENAARYAGLAWLALYSFIFWGILAVSVRWLDKTKRRLPIQVETAAKLGTEVAVPPQDVGLLLVGSTRYALRMTGAVVSHTCEMLMRYGIHLELSHLRLIRAEIGRELQKHKEWKETLGNPCDHALWERTVLVLDGLLERAEHKDLAPQEKV